MNTLEMWRDVLLESAETFGSQLLTAIPPMIGAALLLLLGYLIARFGSGLTKKLLQKTKVDDLGEKHGIDKLLAFLGPKSRISYLLSWFVFVVIGLVFLHMAIETLGWNIVSEQLQNVISYVPKFFGAIVLAFIGIAIARWVRNAIYVAGTSMSLPVGRMISSVVYYILIYIIAISALNHAEIDVSILTQNSNIIFAGLLLTFAIAYGWASQTVVTNMISSSFVQEKFRSGETIRVGKHNGTLLRFEGFHAVLQEENTEVLIPISILVSEKVEIVKT